MTMLFGKVTVPDTSSDMSVKAIPVASVGGVTTGSIYIHDDASMYTLTGYTTFAAVGSATIYICAKPDADPGDSSTWPTAQEVVDNGMPSTPTLPFYLQDIGGSPQPDVRLYFCATASGDGAGELRVGS
jgi:hypothetical protein